MLMPLTSPLSFSRSRVRQHFEGRVELAGKLLQALALARLLAHGAGVDPQCELRIGMARCSMTSGAVRPRENREANVRRTSAASGPRAAE